MCFIGQISSKQENLEIDHDDDTAGLSLELAY